MRVLERRKLAYGALAVALLLASCGGDGDGTEDSGDATDVQGALKEYKEAQDELTLPAGVVWPDSTPTLQPSADAGMFERGVGLQEAQTVWYCAWSKVALTSDGQTRSEALENLNEFPEQFGSNGKFAKGDDVLRQSYTAQLEAARLGDYSLIQRNFELNCPQP